MQTLDIRGEPWTPCQGCPHPTHDACASRRIAALCEQRAKAPDAWGPLIAAMPPEAREPIHRELRQLPAELPPDTFVGPPEWLQREPDQTPAEAPTPDRRGAEARRQLAAMRRVRKTCPNYTAPACGCPSVAAACSRPDRPDEVYPETCIPCVLGQL